MGFLEEIKRRRTFGIISHPDAGKTTLTEKLLLFGGAIQEAGAVKSNKIKKGATSDFMEIERQRGISVATSVLAFVYKDKKINMDFKNVQRRVYDALNVLSALNIIDKGRGQIKFRGSPYVSGGGIEVFGSHGAKNTKK